MFVRRIQVKPSTREYGTQTLVLKRTIGTQYEEQTSEEDTSGKLDGIQEHEVSDDDVEEDHPSDGDYIPSDECKVAEEELDIETDIQEVLHADEPYKERQFLVTESCLLELLSKCKHCGDCLCYIKIFHWHYGCDRSVMC